MAWFHGRLTGSCPLPRHDGPRLIALAVLLCAVADPVRAEPPKSEVDRPLGEEGRGPNGRGTGRHTAGVGLVIPPATGILEANVQPIDLPTALRLAHVQNPELLLARQRVVEATAVRQLAAAQFLPSINGGASYDTHTGVLQQSDGNILSVNRSSVYVGAGSNAVAAGTVNIPGIVLAGNVAQGIFAYLATRQLIAGREAASAAVRNQTFLQVALAYSELTRAEGRLAIARQAAEEAREVARMTAEYFATGEGRKADADRAATELARREANIQGSEGDVLRASARLCQVLNLDPSIRLHPTDAAVVPLPIVPDPMPLGELVALALLQRPELAERRAAIREALLALEGAKVLPFSPTVLIGFSSGGFGGGSNLVQPVFGSFGGRSDLDVVGYWTIRNLGIGNVALIRLADARLQVARYQEIGVLNRVRAEVAEAYARTHARYAQIEATERAIGSSIEGYTQDFERVRERAGEDSARVLPIELLDSFRLLNQARYDYLDAIVDYNEAQFELFVALGQPPADALARPVPTTGIAPTAVPPIAPSPPVPGTPGPFADIPEPRKPRQARGDRDDPPRPINSRP